MIPLKNYVRIIYYTLPLPLRFIARRIIYFPIDLVTYRSRKLKMCPPKGLIFTGGGDFLKTGNRLASRLQEHCNLNSNSCVLDIGCGIGRLAVPLTKILGNHGGYVGFDVVKRGVAWCNNNIKPKYSNFSFIHVDLKNDLYNNNGQHARSFIFPFENEKFDIAFAFSVFTHMLPDELEHYLAECYRVLKPGGVFYATFFIEEQNMKGNSKLKFPFQFKNHSLMNIQVKSANVLYDKQYLIRFVQSLGYTVIKHQAGTWNNVAGIDLQDALVLKKPH